MKLMLRTLAVSSILSAVGVAAILTYPAEADDPGSDIWQIVKAQSRIAEADRNMRKIDLDDEHVLRRVAIRLEVIRDLVAGRMTFEEAAERYVELNRMQESALAYMRRTYPGRTDEERGARQLAAHMRNSGNPAAAALGEEWECRLSAQE
ncbi:MAG TPA: hypothetical protein VKD71_13770 [Gemmataceae bacterium]|nr:hypothetical protein [Gemmataceae bacterium]